MAIQLTHGCMTKWGIFCAHPAQYNIRGSCCPYARLLSLSLAAALLHHKRADLLNHQRGKRQCGAVLLEGVGGPPGKALLLDCVLVGLTVLPAYVC